MSIKNRNTLYEQKGNIIRFTGPDKVDSSVPITPADIQPQRPIGLPIPDLTFSTLAIRPRTPGTFNGRTKLPSEGLLNGPCMGTIPLVIG